MKIKAAKFYSAIFVLVLFCQLYLPSFKANIFLQIFAILAFLFIEEGRVMLSRSFLKRAGALFAILLIGFVGTICYHYKLVNVLKDIFHFLKPLVGLLVGYLYFRKVNDFRLFVKTIVISGILSAIIHFFIIALFVRDLGSVESVREFTRDNFLELFALFFLLFYKKFEGTPIIENRNYARAAMVLLTISSILYFSRTMIVIVIILILSIYGYTKITRRTVQFAGAAILLVGLLYVYLFNANIQRGKPGLEAFLYKIKIAPSEILKTNIDRDDHRDLWDHWRGYEAKRAIALLNEKPASLIFGTGHGSLVNLKFYAPLTGDKKGIRYISELHNGYVYILYKTGLAGLLVYLLLLGRLYVFIYARKNLIAIFISAIGLVYLFSTVTITGMFNPRDVIIFILGALLYFKDQPHKTETVA